MSTERTIAQQTYEAQHAAERAHDDLWHHDTIGLDAERIRKELEAKLREQEAEVARLQQLAGGKVFAIYTDNRGDIDKKLAQITRRAEKLGVAAPTITEHETFIEVKHGIENGQRIEIRHEKQFVAVAGAAPKIAGWEFLATLQHEAGGNIVRKVPGADEIDTTAYRTGDPDCAHCGLDRQRKQSYLVRNVESGEIKQVGSSCLADFLGGLSPQAAVQMFTWLDSLDERLSAGERSEGGGIERLIDPKVYLTHVACMMRENGWCSRSKAFDTGGYATADDAENNLFAAQRQQRDRDGQQLWIDTTDEDAARAEKALAWVHDTLAARDNLSDYEHNLVVALTADGLRHKSLGIAASVIRAYEREVERELEAERRDKKREAEADASEWVGEVKERLELTLTVESIFEKEGYYGMTYITKLHDEQGRVFKWFGSYPLEQGETVHGKWTVKGHDEFRGVKETVITRPALKEVAA